MADSHAVRISTKPAQAPHGKALHAPSCEGRADPFWCYSVGYPGPARLGDRLH